MEEFSKLFYVDCKHVEAYVQHLQNLKNVQEMRMRTRLSQKKEKKIKPYQDYNWLDLVVHGKLSSLQVAELDKYLKYQQLNIHGRKDDKLKAVTCDVLRRTSREQQKSVIEKNTGDESEEELCDSEEGDIVLEEIRSDSDTDTSSTSDSDSESDSE